MSQEKYVFKPCLGPEDSIMKLGNEFGSVYFTTDTRKIYLDIDSDKTKIPMGGNINLFYGKMKPGIVVDGQTEFDFKIEDIIGNEDISKILIPNVDDLILNNDGCFYKVLNIMGEGIETILNTEKLTIAGTGGGGSSDGPSVDDGDMTDFKVGKFNVSDTMLLEGSPCYVKFVVKSINDVGEYITGEVGSYKLYINGAFATEGSVNGIPFGEVGDDLSTFPEEHINILNITPYLPTSSGIRATLVIYDSEGRQKASRNLSTISITDVQLTWDYDNKTLNEWIADEKESIKLSWSLTGQGLERITYISIGDNGYPIEIGRGTGSDFEYELKFSEHNMIHGAHMVKMWSEVKVGNNVVQTDPIYKNIIVAQDDNPNTIISICLFDKKLVQYNTVGIPVYIYSRKNISGNASVNLLENGAIKDTWNNVPNLGEDEKKSLWSYTPVFSGDAILLTVQSGGQEKTVSVDVENIGVTIEEKPGYAFKFKASEFSSNTNVENWKIGNNLGLSFSDNFDWINGGLGSEVDEEGGHRQFFAIKAGTTMTINYSLWEKNAPANGKHFKIIFKAVNCRDYDAQVLSCKADKKIININKDVEYFFLTERITELEYSKEIKLNNGQIERLDIQTATLNIDDEQSRKDFENTYVEFDGVLYQCVFIYPDPVNNPTEFYNAWYKVTVEDSFNGLLLKAQNASIKTNNETLDTQYCEDTYIELEVEITKDDPKKSYIKLWIDGVPCGYSTYNSNSDRFILEDKNITIGSSDCDVYLYLAKLYETELSTNDHINNFCADAPNAEEMVKRFKRNNIISTSKTNEIDMYELAKENPDCLVHYYEVSSMPIAKSTKIKGCKYAQYQGSNQAKYSANDVMIRVQGTSSEAYVLAAANLDTDFQGSLVDGKTQQPLPDGWSMDKDALPINYACTKVNVASCENINNLVNQEWYNKFQPYKSVLRCKNPKARDTMQFTSGVIFVKDKSTETGKATGVGNNVFCDTPGYVANPYPKFYSLGQMGNSKDNIHVFHDLENPQECCIEVADNQMPQQWMVQELSENDKKDIGESKKLFEFRYPDGVSNASQEMIDAWNDFVSWMAHSNPQPAYNKFENITTVEQFKDFSINKKTLLPIPVYIMNSDETAHIEVTEFNPEINTYYTKTDSIYGYTEYKLDLPEEQKTFGPKTFNGFIAENQKDETGRPWQQDYVPMIRGCTIDTFAGTYTHDTYEYRMAKMLKECEDHLIMDSVLFHYLFIEHHCMIDNVAKNTFWSTEDCQHWSLIKDYDNDTADGNDNQGKLTRTYGMEPTDRFNANAQVFNAHQSVWFNFVHGLKPVLEKMYEKLENATVLDENGNPFNVWDTKAYLNYCKKIQSTIPERCWIEDYYRKYFRPNEVYSNNMFNSMLQGGQKKYQRKQYETYQRLYMGSKYSGSDVKADRLIFRPTGTGLLDIQIPAQVYSDCYIYTEVGGQVAKTRAKRNQTTYLKCPVNNLGNATMYVHPASNFTKLGSMELTGQLGNFAPDQMSFSSCKKLREIVYATKNLSTKNEGLKDSITFSGTPLLEKIYLCNLPRYESGLDLSDCPSLKTLICKNSSFTDITIADGAPIEEIELEAPTALTLKNLTKLTKLDISNYNKLRNVTLENIDKNIINFSKTILSNAIKQVDELNEIDYVSYKIGDARWLIDEAKEIENTYNITLLEQMLNRNLARPVLGSDKQTELPYSAAFTGKINISSAAYNGTNPLEIYNKYITSDKFANVDMVFESENSKLYNVIIYDGDGIPFWQRKTVSGTTLNEAFLSGGPSGIFDPNALKKSPTSEFEYELLPLWTIKQEGKPDEIVSGQSPQNLIITQDIYIYPTFEVTRRSYEISIKMKHPKTGVISNIVEPRIYEYGTPLNDILPQDFNPYIEDSSLKLFEAYDFKGYSLSEGSSTKVPDNYIVTGNGTLWAIFKLESDIRTVVHPEWFNVRDNFVYENSIDTLYNKTEGVQLSPAKILKGKITIPTKVIVNGVEKPVISLAGFGGLDENTPSLQEITHIFMEKNKENILYHIENNAFFNSPKLKYFDFDNCSIRTIDANAFQLCRNLTNTTFGSQLIDVGARGFNQSISVSNETLYIPSSLQKIGERGFSILNTKNCYLQIGTPDILSRLEFERDNEPFAQNTSNMFEETVFYSNLYSEGDLYAIEILSDSSNCVHVTKKSVDMNHRKDEEEKS